MIFLNWLNRALVVLVLLLVFVGALAFAIVPYAVAEGVKATLTSLEGGELATRGVSAAVAVVALLLLVLELRVRRPGAVALAGDAGAHVATNTVVERIRGAVEEVPDVVQARPVVTPGRRGVDVELPVETAPGVDVPAKAAEVRQVAAAEVERLGLKLANLRVRISHSGRAMPVRREELPPPES